jgi:hypothetical protein
MSVSITCTAIATSEANGTVITAQASADEAVTWNLLVTPSGGGPGQTLTATDSVQNGLHTAEWDHVPSGTYTVSASANGKSGVSKGVPFGTCS